MHAIIDFEKIEDFLSDLRSNNEIEIAFSNGCFDILHRGHVEYLEKAKSRADVLIIGLNSDNSVRRLKGEGRPYISQDDRAYILSRLEAVDIVCIFDQDTPVELLQRVKPDYLLKGADYTPEQIVGRDFVESYGGKVLTVPLVKGKSSSSIIGKIWKADRK